MTEQAGSAPEPPSVAELELFLRAWTWQRGDEDFLLDAIIPEGGYAPLTISGLRAVVADLRHAQCEAERLTVQSAARLELLERVTADAEKVADEALELKRERDEARRALQDPEAFERYFRQHPKAFERLAREVGGRLGLRNRGEQPR